jgi:hypothetical protein
MTALVGVDGALPITSQGRRMTSVHVNKHPVRQLQGRFTIMMSNETHHLLRVALLLFHDVFCIVWKELETCTPFVDRSPRHCCNVTIPGEIARPPSKSDRTVMTVSVMTVSVMTVSVSVMIVMTPIQQRYRIIMIFFLYN